MNNLGMNDGSNVKCLNHHFFVGGVVDIENNIQHLFLVRIIGDLHGIILGWIHSVDIDLEGKVKDWMNCKAIVRNFCLEMTYLIKGRRMDEVFGFGINALSSNLVFLFPPINQRMVNNNKKSLGYVFPPRGRISQQHIDIT